MNIRNNAILLLFSALLIISCLVVAHDTNTMIYCMMIISSAFIAFVILIDAWTCISDTIKDRRFEKHQREIYAVKAKDHGWSSTKTHQ